MNIVTLLSLCILATLCESVSFSDYLRYIPRFGKVNEVSRQEVSEWPPKFCNKLACPKFTVVKSFPGKFEVREYEKSNWVSTNTADVDYASASTTNFRRLFDYISGDNEQREKINMTAPVIDRIIPGPGPACESNFTMSFYVTNDNGPKPSNPKVFLQTFPPLRVYVRSFGGYYMNKIDKWLEEAVKLDQYLKTAGYTYNKKFFYIGGYDSPVRFINRHNEVWFLAE